ncbi:MAG: hypothetical protein ED556_03625 [Winogradskyella sp.]|uniref:OB-fold protein n=1 Tax=Winogradskyella sp. TaxID=1883156 RepID=UPI000F3BE079|nr:hypothetical protein [Winogradskyella sp.]RNC88284.1 MAG: hypothetical protein ED556_03625 [Winogradskyella sp.]
MNRLISLKRIAYIIILIVFSCSENHDKMVNENEAIQHINILDENTSIRNIDQSLIDEVILVEGLVKNVNSLNNRNTIIIKGTNNELVICDMQKNQEPKLNAIHVGDTLAIKGILVGTLKDVIVHNCVITDADE